MSNPTVLSIEAMGGDAAPEVAVDGLALFCEQRENIKFILHGDEIALRALLEKHPETLKRCELRHTDIFVRMEDKPSQALRKARGSSMWNAVECVKKG